MLLLFGYIAPLSIHLQDWFWPSSLWRVLIRIDPAFCKMQETIEYHWIASCIYRLVLFGYIAPLSIGKAIGFSPVASGG